MAMAMAMAVAVAVAMAVVVAVVVRPPCSGIYCPVADTAGRQHSYYFHGSIGQLATNNDSYKPFHCTALHCPRGRDRRTERGGCSSPSPPLSPRVALLVNSLCVVGVRIAHDEEAVASEASKKRSTNGAITLGARALSSKDCRAPKNRPSTRVALSNNSGQAAAVTDDYTIKI
ncbi:hypothetical protein BX661DRAFT_176287 [Kickxella alabastrina]|uniref:uncharacterized protein n=1 Tax=Kickxella alabastrina TaxID=61397 RepID=UPI0022204F48|nr:uncharacterized protein BX661DRAFT_176287 [Kickxella alabastrina]KAI7835199.1 hypothetical protein BX661DRAFT_176287 [Kickxella alabastrina]